MKISLKNNIDDVSTRSALNIKINMYPVASFTCINCQLSETAMKIMS